MMSTIVLLRLPSYPVWSSSHTVSTTRSSQRFRIHWEASTHARMRVYVLTYLNEGAPMIAGIKQEVHNRSYVIHRTPTGQGVAK